MKKTRFVALALVLCISLLASCMNNAADNSGSDTGNCKQNGENHILKAWTGEFSEEKLKDTIAEYQEDYEAVDNSSGEKVASVSFETDFDIAGVRVSRVSSVDDNNIDVELNGYLDLFVETEYSKNKITVYTDWWYRDGGWVQNYPIWSYLVRITDADGGKHYYYFRVDYSLTDSEPVNYTCDLSAFPTEKEIMGYGEVRQVEEDRLLIIPVSAKAREEYGEVVWLLCKDALAYSIGQTVSYTFCDVKAPDAEGEPLNISALQVYME